VPPSRWAPTATSASADKSGGVGLGGTVRSGSDKCQNRTDEKWIRRCRPERNMFELGLFGGIMFPASGLIIDKNGVMERPSRVARAL
jgi:hypothetical protein